jgi:hypothetical protein
MSTLTDESINVDLEIRKQLNSLISLKEEIEAKLADSDKLSPLREMELKNSLQSVDETIGKIRFHSLDNNGEFTNRKPLKFNTDGLDFNSSDSENTKKDIEKQSPGSFSVSEQQSPSLSDQVGKPKKVDAVKEQASKTSVSVNNDNYYEKGFDPEQDEDTFYNSFDRILGIDISKMADIIGADQKLPRGTKRLARESEYYIYHGLRKAVNEWFMDVEKDTDPYSALSNLKMNLMKWNLESKTDSSNTVQELYNRGLDSGLRKSGRLPPKHIKVVTESIHKANGIGPALDKFRDDCYSNISSIMKRHIHDGEHALYRSKREMDSWLRKQRFQTRLMVKTEVAKIANFGLIESWGYDEDRYTHRYFWDAIIDDRTKEISRIRKMGNPYTFDEIKWLWKHQAQVIDGTHWQNDAYNQRCSISREKIDKEFEGNRFKGKETEFNQTM